ncbi:MAG: hypothetical protein ACI8QQ_003209, partial [Psychroserpens sp.]
AGVSICADAAKDIANTANTSNNFFIVIYLVVIFLKHVNLQTSRPFVC